MLSKLSHTLKGGRHFQNVSYSGGFAYLQKGHGVGFGDIDNDNDNDNDNDGDQDVY